MTIADSIIQLRELVGDARVAMVTSRAPSGELHSRPLLVGEIDDSGGLVFLVDASADWVAGLRPDDAVNVAIAKHHERTWVSVAGHPRVVDDRPAVQRLWSDEAARFLPDGIDSPNVAVLTVLARTVEYWDVPSTRLQRLLVAAKAALGSPGARAGTSGSIRLGA